MPVPPSVNTLTWKIIECAIAVHRALGPGLLESAYLACLIAELRHAGLRVDVGVKVPIVYRGLELNCGYKLDLLWRAPLSWSSRQWTLFSRSMKHSSSHI